jgi:DNA-binding XRE family transcriptional regulator
MTEELTGRIQEVMKEYSYTPSVFADEIGVQRPAISHILSGRNRPSLDIVLKILKKFPKINSHWLLTGEGKMIQLNLFGQPEAPQNTEPSISEKIEPEIKSASPDMLQVVENQLVTSHSSRDLNTGISPDISPATVNSQADNFQASVRVPQGDSLYHSQQPETPLLKDVTRANRADSFDMDTQSSAQTGNYSVPGTNTIASPLPHKAQAVERQNTTTDNQYFNNNSTHFSGGIHGNQDQPSGFSGQRLSHSQANTPDMSGFSASEYARQFDQRNTTPYSFQNPDQQYVRQQSNNYSPDNQHFKKDNSYQEHYQGKPADQNFPESDYARQFIPGNTAPHSNQHPNQQTIRHQFNNYCPDNQNFISNNSHNDYYQGQPADQKIENGPANRQPFERSRHGEHNYAHRNHNQTNDYQYFNRTNHLNRPEDLSPDRQFHHQGPIHDVNQYGYNGRSPQHFMENGRSGNHFYDNRNDFSNTNYKQTGYQQINHNNYSHNYSGYQQSGYPGENRYFPPAVNDEFRYYNTPHSFHPYYNPHADHFSHLEGIRFNDHYYRGYPDYKTTQSTHYQPINNQYRDFNRYPEHTPAGFHSAPVRTGFKQTGESNNPATQEGSGGQHGQFIQNNVNNHPSGTDNQGNPLHETSFTDPRQANLFPDYQSTPVNAALHDVHSKTQVVEVQNTLQYADNQKFTNNNSANLIHPATAHSRTNGITTPPQEGNKTAPARDGHQISQSMTYNNNIPAAESGSKTAESRKLSDYEVINMAQNLLQAAESGRKPEKIIIFWSDKTFGIYSPEP